MTNLPAGFKTAYVQSGPVKLHVVHNVEPDDKRPAIMFLHGFPEYWVAWKPVFERLAVDHAVIAPDQRGYNLSDAPQDVESYAVKHLVADAAAVARDLLGNRRFFLAGHDWGASVAYAFAIGRAESLNGLIIANGVHPVLFQKALVEDPDQRQASQYFHYLRAEGAAERMSADNFRRTFSMFEKFSAVPWLTEEERAGYREAWSRPGRLNAMLNWYRGSPIVVPNGEKPASKAPLATGTPEKFGIKVPHLLIWGEADQALRPAAFEGLEAFAENLEVVRIPKADHWLLHENPELIASHIGRFIRHNGNG